MANKIRRLSEEVKISLISIQEIILIVLREKTGDKAGDSFQKDRQKERYRKIMRWQ